MKKILFTHSYFYRFDPKQWDTKQPYPPLGTIYAAAVMREAGYDVSLFDTALIETPDKIIPVIEDQNPDYLVIYDDGFNYLTKMCLTNMRQAAFRMAALAKEKGITVITSSSDAADHYEKYIANGVDFVVIGEGEITLKELFKKLNDKETNFSEVDGLAYNENNKIIRTSIRQIVKELDSFPFPAWDLVDISSYKKIWMENRDYFSLNIATTRGCPFKCNWCAKPIYGNRYNSRSPQKVADEIEFLLNKYDVRHFWMCDDIFGLKPGWVKEFRDIVKAKKLKFNYKIQSRVDLLLQEDTIEALAESGAETVWVGAESGSQKILDAMDKGTKVEQIYEATKLLRKNGIRTAFFLQFGYLGEEKEDIEKTINMVLDLMPEEIGISVSYPLPGTKFYEKVKEQLKEKANWTDSDDLAMMYKGTFSPSFYRKLHRYVHKVYRRKQSLLNLKDLLFNPFNSNRKKLRSAISSLYYIPASLVDSVVLRKLESVK
ncbi:MAG: B12-binding domain-containing radical SAM protein [Ignavibacteriaceae bacterium]|nr:B12-binding domain-containing radical SAM protein [Chlorobium sp.]MCW8823524.1 B12-binding domain-containing radical SAM protein [Ignavibacteriaceae bacterium]MCW8960302.1 B12-binding domain-containing radical SAM protein [Ignavibacteriaceae bacterium]MCW8995309.1 B12-binding domain-containing radical SAM protein [Psychromonas sp.]